MTSFLKEFKMGSKLRLSIEVGASALVTLIALSPVIKRSHTKHKQVMVDLELDRTAMWIASGVIQERVRNGKYTPSDKEKMLTDWEFERIRIIEEGHLSKTFTK